MQILFVRHAPPNGTKRKDGREFRRAAFRCRSRPGQGHGQVSPRTVRSSGGDLHQRSVEGAGDFGVYRRRVRQRAHRHTVTERGPHRSLSGVEIEESFKTHGRLIQKWRSDPWADMPETESLGELQRRSVGFLKYVEGLYKDGQSIIVVSHASFIKSVLCYVLGMPLQNNYSFNLDNCSISTIRAGEGGTGWRLFELNIHRHLAQVR